MFANETTIKQIYLKNPHIIKSSSFSFNVWKTWCQEKIIANKMKENELAEQNKPLGEFYA